MQTALEPVVLVHGLWMHGLVFLPQRRGLERRGFSARTFSYRSLHHGLAENAAALATFVGEIEAPVIHLVGHSLGGLIVLSMLARRPDPRIGRIVLMGSPYGGSHAAKALIAAGLSAMVGRSIREWLAAPPPVLSDNVEIGVLAGDRSLGLGRVIPNLPQPNDGVVTLDETRIPGSRDSILLPVAHSQMLVSAACTDQVAAFLRTGRFQHPPSARNICADGLNTT